MRCIPQQFCSAIVNAFVIENHASDSSRVLLVEKSSDMRCFLRNCVRTSCLQTWMVDEAQTGIQAVRYLDSTHVVVIVGTIASGEAQLVSALRSMRALHEAIHIVKLRCWDASPSWCDAALQHPVTERDVQAVIAELLEC